MLGTSFFTPFTSFFNNAYQWYQRCLTSLFEKIGLDVEFDLMLQRLAARRASPVVRSKSLNGLISQEDLNKIVDYFLIGGRQNKAIAALFPGEAYRLDKRYTGLPRTVTILRSEMGEFQFILETKSKLANNQKQRLANKAGSSKKGKPAFRIDGSTVAYFNLVVSNTDSQRDLERVQKETEASHFFNSPYIQYNILGPWFKGKRGNYKINIYSLRAKADLADYLSQAKLTPQEKEQMILDLLLGVKILHDKNYVHQDLKPGNTLVNKNNLSLTDLGSLELHQSKEEVLTTPEYCSPELVACVRDKNIFNQRLCYGHVKNNYGNNVPSAFSFPHKANDMWALGIMVYEIYYGKRPTFLSDTIIRTHPLLAGLLCPLREKRLTIDEALSLHLESMQKIDPINQQKKEAHLTRAKQVYEVVHQH